FSRRGLGGRFLRRAAILGHPTHGDSFGLGALEGPSPGLAVVAPGGFPPSGLVNARGNGVLITPPLSTRADGLPSPPYFNLENIKDRLNRLDTRSFEEELARRMIEAARTEEGLRAFRRASLELLASRFLGNTLANGI